MKSIIIKTERTIRSHMKCFDIIVRTNVSRHNHSVTQDDTKIRTLNLENQNLNLQQSIYVEKSVKILGGTSSTRYLYNDFTFEAIMQKLVGEKNVHGKRILDRIWLKNGTNRPLFFTIGRWRYEKSCFHAKIT